MPPNIKVFLKILAIMGVMMIPMVMTNSNSSEGFPTSGQVTFFAICALVIGIAYQTFRNND